MTGALEEAHVNERRLTFSVTSSQLVRGKYGNEVALTEFLVRGVRVDPKAVRVGHVMQEVKLICSANDFESWRFMGPYKCWGPWDVLTFDGWVSTARQVQVTVKHEPKDLSWTLPVAGAEK